MEQTLGLSLPRRRRLGTSALSAFADDEDDARVDRDGGAGADGAPGDGPPEAGVDGSPLERLVRPRLAGSRSPPPDALLDMGEKAAVEGNVVLARSLLLRAAGECLRGETADQAAQLADALRMLAQLADGEEDAYGALYFARGAVRASTRAIDLLRRGVGGGGAEGAADGGESGEVEGAGGSKQEAIRGAGGGERDEVKGTCGGSARRADGKGKSASASVDRAREATLDLASSWRQTGRAYRNAGLPREAARAFAAARERLEGLVGSGRAADRVDGRSDGDEDSVGSSPLGRTADPPPTSPPPEARTLLAEVREELQECSALARLEVGRRVGLEGVVLVPPEEAIGVGEEEAAWLARDEDAEDAWEAEVGREGPGAGAGGTGAGGTSDGAGATFGHPEGRRKDAGDEAALSAQAPGTVRSVALPCSSCSAPRRGNASRAEIIRSLRGPQDAGAPDPSACFGARIGGGWQTRADPSPAEAFDAPAEPGHVWEDDVEVFAATFARDAEWDAAGEIERETGCAIIVEAVGRVPASSRSGAPSPPSFPLPPPRCTRRVLEVTRHRGLCGLVFASRGMSTDVLSWSDLVGAHATRGGAASSDGEAARSALERAVAGNAEASSRDGGSVRVLSEQAAMLALFGPSGGSDRATRSCSSNGRPDDHTCPRSSDAASNAGDLSPGAYDACIFVDVVQSSADVVAAVDAIDRLLRGDARPAALLAHRSRSDAVDVELLAAVRARGLSLRALAREASTRSSLYSVETLESIIEGDSEPLGAVIGDGPAEVPLAARGGGEERPRGSAG